MVLPLAVVAFLFLFGLSTCVVLALLFLFLRSGLGRRGSPLEFPQPRFNLVHESNIVVVLHDSSGGFVVSTTQSAGPQIGVTQITYFHSCHAQRDRTREESHAERHRESRLARHRENRGEYWT